MTHENIRVLMVEDDEEDYMITRDMFSDIRNTNYSLDWVSNYDDAIEQISLALHDVYLIDYKLGAHDGFELVGYFIQRNFELPFIIITGMSDYETDVKAMQIGAADYLIKGQISEALLERSIRYAIAHKKTEKELKAANNTKNKLFSIISHDLRGLIASISIGLEVISKDKSLDEIKRLEIIEEIKKNTDNTFQLLKNLLFWSRAQQGSINLYPEKFKIGTVINENVKLLAGSANHKYVDLTFDSVGDIPVFADKEMINLVLRNLISNAIKFTPKDGNVSVKVITAKEKVHVTITDTGIGISNKNIRKILNTEEFYTTFGTNHEKGTGLGINLCKEFLEKNGGELWIESKVNQGTTFGFTLG